MALLESWLYKRITGNAEVAKLVATRVAPIYAPETTSQSDPNQWKYPFLTYMRIQTDRTYIGGAKAGSDGLPICMFHVNCWDRDYENLKLVQQAVRMAVESAAMSIDGFFIDHCFIKNESDIPEPIIAGLEFPTYGVRFELEIAGQEPLPA